MKLKKALATLLTLCMVLGLLPTAAFAVATGSETASAAAYDAKTGVLTITGEFVSPGDPNITKVTISDGTGSGEDKVLTAASTIVITSATLVTVTIAGADKTAVDALYSANGTASDQYSVSLAAAWGGAGTKDFATIPVTVSGINMSAITVAYDDTTPITAGTGITLKATGVMDSEGTTLVGNVAATVTSDKPTDGDSGTLLAGVNCNFTDGAANVVIPAEKLKTAGTTKLQVTFVGVTPGATPEVTVTVNPAAAAKLVVKTQPAAPATNGAVLATQPTVEVQDKYGNKTASTASIVATPSAATWTLGGTTAVAAEAGTATFAGLTAACAAEAKVDGAIIKFTVAEPSMTVNSATFNIPAPVTPDKPVAPAATIDYAAETITGVTTAHEYIIDTTEAAPANWTGATPVTGTTIDISAHGAEKQYAHIRVKADGQTPAGTAQDFEIKARPAVTTYTVNFATETTTEAIPTTVNYSAKLDMTSPTHGGATKLALTPGMNVYFQTPATETTFKSPVQTLTVAARPAGPADANGITITTGTAAGTIGVSVADTHQYQIVSADGKAVRKDWTLGTGAAVDSTANIVVGDLVKIRIKAAQDAFASLPSAKTKAVIAENIKKSSVATLKDAASVKFKGVAVTALGTPKATIDAQDLVAGTLTLTVAQAKSSGTSNLTTNHSGARVEKVVKYAAAEAATITAENFKTATAYFPPDLITDGDVLVVKVVAEDTTTTLFYKFTVTVTKGANDLAIKGGATTIASMQYGETKQIETTGGNGGKLTFVSSAPTLLSVSETGLVTALGYQGVTSATIKVSQAETTDVAAKGETLALTVTALAPRLVTLDFSKVLLNDMPYNNSDVAIFTKQEITVKNAVEAHKAVTVDTTHFAGTFANKNVSNSIKVTLGGATLTGADAAYYTITDAVYPEMTAAIIPRSIKVTPKANLTKVYGDAKTLLIGDFDVEANNGTLGLATGEDATVLTGLTVSCAGQAATADVGSYYITSPTITNKNYDIILDGTTNKLAVTKKTLGYTPTTITKVYDGTDVLTTAEKTALEAGLNGVVNDDVVHLDFTAVTYNAKTVHDSTNLLGTPTLAATGDSANYSWTYKANDMKGVINKLELSLKNTKFNGKTSAGVAGVTLVDANYLTVPEGYAALTGAVSYTVTDAGTTGATITDKLLKWTTAGDAVLTVALATDTNYTLKAASTIAVKIQDKEALNGSFEIPANIYGSVKPAVYTNGTGQETATFDVEYNAAGGEETWSKDVPTVAGAHKVRAKATGASAATLGTSADFDFVIARYDLAEKLKALPISKVYDGTTAIVLGNLGDTPTIIGVGTGDSAEKFTVTAITATYADKNIIANPVVNVTSVTLTVVGSTLATNYRIGATELAASGSATALDPALSRFGVITPKPLTAKTAAAAGNVLDKPYDGTRTLTVANNIATLVANAHFTGMIAGDSAVTFTIKKGAYADAFAAAAIKGDHTVTLPASAIVLNDNYVLPKTATFTAAITIRPLTVAAANKTIYTDEVTNMQVGNLLAATTPLATGDTMNSIFNAKLTFVEGAAGVADNKWTATPTNGPEFTVIFYQPGKSIDNANRMAATPSATGVYNFTIVAAAKADFGNYDLTQLTIPEGQTKTLTIENRPSSGGGGGGGSVIAPKPEAPKTDASGNSVVVVPVKPTNNGSTSTATVSDKTMQDAINSAVKAADGKGSASVELKVDAPKGAKTVETKLTAKSVTAMSDGKTSGLKISTPLADLNFDTKALAAIGADGKDVKISAAVVDTTKLTPAQKAQVGDAPMFDFTVTAGGKTVSDFAGGSATVSAPYTLKEGTTAEFVTVWLVADDGSITPVEAKYADGKITFTTGHFSRYAIGYLPFDDVKADWAYGSIVYAFNNKIFSGMGDNKFAPTANMSRAMVWSVLYRMAGSPDKTADTNWYGDAQKWAIAQKISDGTNPDGNVTRQELATTLYRYAKAEKTAADLKDVTDASAISDWAADAMNWAFATKLLKGSEGKLNPQGNATRAEVATILQRFAAMKK